MIDLARVRAFTFDCYGTLIDWETGLKGILNAWAGSANVALRDDELLEVFAKHEASVEAAQPALLYSDVLRHVMHNIGRELSATVTSEWEDRLALSVGEWPAFTDSAESLLRLKRSNFQLCILSNVDHKSFAGSRRKLIADFDLVVTAEDIGSYKPSPKNFSELLRLLGERGISRDEVVHVAQSLYHDHVPAKQIGLKSIWIDRRAGTKGSGATMPATHAHYDLRFTSMREMADWATQH
jgi:putative hydrolase of the HAD superfamily